MLPYTLAEVAQACGGVLENGDPGRIVQAVSIDSRSVQPEDLFIGIRGEHFDGDAYASDALRAGAAAVVVGPQTTRNLAAGSARIVVDDGLRALQALAASVRRRSGVRVVAITGSVGKTATKDILAALLHPVARIVATPGNLNNEIGLPLTLLSIKRDTEVVVAELAMRAPGQIRHLARITRPDVAVITNVAPVHLELLGSVEEVARAKAELIEELGEGSLVVPADKPLLAPYVAQHRGRIVTFGIESGGVCAPSFEARQGGTHALIDALGRRAAFDFSFTGEHYLTDALAAIGALIEVGYSLEQGKLGAGAIEFSELRGEVTDLPARGLLLNDCYNANPVSMRAALDHLALLDEGRPQVAILGDMYELGPGWPGFHRGVGQYAAAQDVRVVAIGDLAREYLVGAPGETWFGTVDECLAALPDLVEAGDAVLVKASRALRLERVADVLLGRQRVSASVVVEADAGQSADEGGGAGV